MKRRFRIMKSNKGFSLVELIVVIAIMAIIAAVAVPVYNIYIEKTEKANDKKLVSDILYALKLGSESSFDANGQSSFIVNGQFSQGIEIPIGFVVISNETLTTTNAKGETVSGTMISLSNDANKDPIHEALVASFGSDYSSNILLNHNNWSVSTMANAIANYGQSAGDLAYQEAYELAGGGWKGKIAGEAAKQAANAAAPDATFPYAATNKAFDDSSYTRIR